MTQLLLPLGALTLGGSAAIALLALMGRSTRARYGARWRCWAWLVLCLRLAVPLPLLPKAADSALIQVSVPPETVLTQPLSPRPSPGQPAQSGDTSAQPSSPAPPAQSAGSQTEEVNPPQAGLSLSPAQLLTALWLAGAAAVLLWSGVAHARLLAYLRRWGRPVSDSAAIQLSNQLGDRLKLNRRPQLMVCQGLRAPMLAGVLRPKLLLPPELPGRTQLEHSLLHELTHYRRRDIPLKTLALWVKALYWFNPLSWLMFRLLERDTELACDEAVLRLLPPEEHGAYGQTILTAAVKK